MTTMMIVRETETITVTITDGTEATTEYFKGYGNDGNAQEFISQTMRFARSKGMVIGFVEHPAA